MSFEQEIFPNLEGESMTTEQDPRIARIMLLAFVAIGALTELKRALAEVFADTSGEREENIGALTELKEICAGYIGLLEEMKDPE